MSFVISLIANLVGAFFAGVQFARLGAKLTKSGDRDRDLSLTFASALLAFTIPFFAPVSNNLGASVSLFISLAAITTLVASRCTK
ncbi:hypothetical protein H8R18_03760 [Nanchangia anserum]|uniref:Uncharacterized protein n=1 Tax=Nanchangia anserum TaxID=2692125 RepID=A0A8I0GAX6_9ACTO|nr:hypothetical protein [Nanchangia anserum]MBD3688676.1 hypothetical protein [Nanchangia anserum]QOX82429.1 hypothetical protein H8R18_03760 [Nanchangia anserum]